MINFRNKEKSVFQILLALLSLVLISPHAYQFFFGFNLILGEDSYHKLNMIKGYSENSMEHFNQPFDALLVYFSKVIEPEFLFKILPFISGLLSILLLYLILQKLKIDKTKRLYSVFFVGLSPLFLNSSILFSVATIIIPFIMAGFLLLLNRRFKISALLFYIVSFFEPVVFLTLVLPIFYHLNTTKAKIEDFLAFLVAGLFGTLVYFKYFAATIIPTFSRISVVDFLFKSLNVFGAKEGISLIMLILASVFLISRWKKRKKDAYYYGILALLLLSIVMFDSSIKYLMSVLISVFAGLGFVKIMKMKWELDRLRIYVKYIVIFAVIFSAFLYIDNLIDSSPDIDLVESLKKIKEDVPFGNYVLTNPSYSEIILYFSGYESIFSKDSDKDLVEFVFENHDDRTLDILSENQVSFIVVDDSSKKLMRTKKGINGLEFLMEHNSCFKVFSRHNSVVVWEFVC